MAGTSRLLGSFSLLLTVGFGSLSARAQNTTLRIEESKIEVRLSPRPGVTIPIQNSTSQAISVVCAVELVSTSDGITIPESVSAIVQPGRRSIELDWPLLSSVSSSTSDLGWYRLRYRITPQQAPDGDPTQSQLGGIVQLGSVLKDGFSVRLVAAAHATPGSRFPVRVQVTDTRTERPLRSVPVNIELNTAGEEAIVKAAQTDSRGHAVVAFELPRDPKDSEAHVRATATRGGFREQASLDFTMEESARLFISTDKPLYQPGQTAHLRVLALAPDGRALAGETVTFSIEDDNGEKQLRTDVKTSEFGIASADWTIPDRARFGNYAVHVKRGVDEDSDDYWSEKSDIARIRVSRYELPTFTVDATPDRSYYLPGQPVSVDVGGTYLFGQRVQRGQVRIVLQGEREWDRATGTWNSEDKEIATGALGESGTLRTVLDLHNEFEDMVEEIDDDDIRPYRDLKLAAFVTDASTGRTEQRRFQVRLSARPIHLYVQQPYSVSLNEPVVLFVRSYYADGTPAQVDGEITASDREEPSASETAYSQTVARFRTNRRGIARVDLPRLPDHLLPASDWTDPRDGSAGVPRWRTAYLKFEGRDRQGRRGLRSDSIQFEVDGAFVQVRSAKALFRPGEPIELSLASSFSNAELFVSIANSKELLHSRMVPLRNGKARLTVPYESKFRGLIHVTATHFGSKSRTYWGGYDDGETSGETAMLYPAIDDLTIRLEAPETVAPGQEISASIRVRTSEGFGTQTALGVLVYDRAVAERVRTDEEFDGDEGSFFRSYYRFRQGLRSSVGGVSLNDLLRLNPALPYPLDRELAAQALLSYAERPWSLRYEHDSAGWKPREAHLKLMELMKQPLQPANRALQAIYLETSEYPGSEDALRRALTQSTVNLGATLDPWDRNYRTTFGVEGSNTVLRFVSDGIDKRADTDDDFTVHTYRWPYFRKTGLLMDAVNADFLSRTSTYIRTYGALRDEMRKRDIDLDLLRDPWGRPYHFHFDAHGAYYRILVWSGGPDGKFTTTPGGPWSKGDDVLEWTSLISYFAVQNAAIQQGLAEHFALTQRFPQNEAELAPILESARLGPEQLLDPWGRPYRFSFSEKGRYSDLTNIRYRRDSQGVLRGNRETTPVTESVAYINVLSGGAGGDSGSLTTVAEFSRTLVEWRSHDIQAFGESTVPEAGSRGAIEGVVLDASGAVIPGAAVTAISETGVQFTMVTGQAGQFLLTGLPTGYYRLACTMAGFQSKVLLRVPVYGVGSTVVDIRLEVGSVAETVMVSGEAPSVETTASSVGVVVEREQISELPLSGRNLQQLFTPRLRHYFPETLLWRPEVITDKGGRSTIKFPMADSITSWRMSVVASTRDGQMGTAERELRSFQPFFLEHDPPRTLTLGDRIDLPVVLRNYQDRAQTLQTEMHPESWFAMRSPAQEQVRVEAGGDASATFSFEAIGRVRNGKQRVTARNRSTGDAVKHEIHVHPHGEEVWFTSSKILTPSQNTINTVIPDNAIPGSAEAELRIYPNLLAHVLDAMDGIGRRPTGCAEQITSTAYVSLMALELLQKWSQDKPADDNPRSAVALRAQRALRQAVEMLKEKQLSDGGITYWSKGESDLALSAYVYRFLVGASRFIEVDRSDLGKLRAYLLSRQNERGAWYWQRWYDPKTWYDSPGDPGMTSYLARTLATTMGSLDADEREKAAQAVTKALQFIEAQADSWLSSYVVGNYALAAAATGRQDFLEQARQRLEQVEHREGDSLYWNVETNTTLFYGWGWTGRMEMTALAVQALSKLRSVGIEEVGPKIDGGLQFLLAHKDRYATWYSTQATQNVLEALISALPDDSEAHASTATVVLNGSVAREVTFPAGREATGPVVIGLGGLSKGTNQIQVIGAENRAVNASLITSYYVPWIDQADSAEAVEESDSRSLRLNVQYDRIEASVGDTIRCRVQAERSRFRGYGMMLAEVGLPPGAEIDRNSLEQAAKNVPGLDSYEVQPDRVVFYLWPRAGGISFGFAFRVRLSMEAMTAPSQLYDYYNPEAAATVAPVQFMVR
jgi:hypothetical protein